MIRHIVLVRFKPETSQADIESIFADLKSLQPLPGIRQIAAGRSLELEKLDKGFLHGFVVEFEDRASLAAYQADPDHRKIAARLVAAAQGGLAGVLVFDLEA